MVIQRRANGDPRPASSLHTSTSSLPYPLCISSVPATSTPKPPCNLKLSGELMAHNTTDPSLLGGDHRQADAGDEAFALKVPHEADPSWVELGWLSALLGALQDTPPAPTDPAGGELAVGLSGDLYYIASGAPQKSDDSLGDQFWKRMGWDEQDYVANLEKKQDSVDDTPVSLG